MYISWTPSHKNADTPLAKGNADVDLLAARGCGATSLTRFSSYPSPPRTAPLSPPNLAPPRRSSAQALLRVCGERGSPRIARSPLAPV